MKTRTIISKAALMVYGVPVVAWLVYVVLVLLGPATSAVTQPVDQTTLNLIRLSFALPLLVIWLIAARSAARFHHYAGLIKGSAEGKAFRSVTHGLLGLLGYVIVLVILARLAPLFANTSFLNPTIFIKNHLPVVVALGAFALLYLGSARLLATVSVRPVRYRSDMAWLGFVAFAALFAAFFYSHPIATVNADGIPQFVVGRRFLMFSVIVPSLLSWALGIKAGLNLLDYAREVKGSIYKASLRRLAIGLYVSIAFIILVQLLVLNSSLVSGLGTGWVLVILYSFLAAYGAGAWLIARSAKRLTLIEVAL